MPTASPMPSPRYVTLFPLPKKFARTISLAISFSVCATMKTIIADAKRYIEIDDEMFPFTTKNIVPMTVSMHKSRTNVRLQESSAHSLKKLTSYTSLEIWYSYELAIQLSFYLLLFCNISFF
jgi:hypothetical protein